MKGDVEGVQSRKDMIGKLPLKSISGGEVYFPCLHLSLNGIWRGKRNYVPYPPQGCELHCADVTSTPNPIPLFRSFLTFYHLHFQDNNTLWRHTVNKTHAGKDYITLLWWHFLSLSLLSSRTFPKMMSLFSACLLSDGLNWGFSVDGCV